MQAILKSATAFLGLAAPPTVSVNKGSLAVISASYNNIEVFGITNDQKNLAHISFNGSVWSPWSLLDLNGGFYKSAPSAVSTQSGSFDVFVTNTDDKIITRNFNGTSWRPNIGWQHMRDDYEIEEAGNPVAMSPMWARSVDRYNLYTRKTNGEILTIYNIEGYPDRFACGYWSGFYAKSSPINIITGSVSMEIFYIGLDDYMYHWHWSKDDDDSWIYQDKIGDQKFISSPTIVTNAPGCVDVFGIASDRTVMHNSYQNSTNAWTGWKQLGTRRFASALSAIVPQGSKQIEVWGLGEDGGLWHCGGGGADNSWPVDWDSYKGNFISAPTLVSPAAGVYEVFAIDTNGAVKHARHIETPDTWKPAYQAWDSLGGSMKAFG